MDEATLCRALGLDLPSPTSPDRLAAPTSPDRLAALASPNRLAALTQAMTEITDELDGLSSRLALVARALTETVAATRRMAQLSKDEARAQMSTRERLQDSAGDEDTDGLVDEAVREEAGGRASDVALLQAIEDPDGDRCGNCGSLLPAGGVGWLCAPCELVAGPIEGASVASAGGAGPPPLEHSELTP